MTSSSSSKTEFSCIFYDVFDVGGYAGSSRLEVSLLCLLSIPPLPLLTITNKFGRCFDATRLPLSNKLEFAQFGAHMKRLWQFWFSLEYSLFSWLRHKVGPSGSTATTAVVPLKHPSGSTALRAVVPLFER